MDDTGRILGVDPGLNRTGYAVLQWQHGQVHLHEAGVVRNRANAPLESKLAELFEGMRDVIASFCPQSMAVEELYSHYKRPRTAILMGHARGVICLAAAERGIPVKPYAATQIKKMLTGSGRATKQQMQLAICREFSLPQPPEPHDVADAMAIALCHLFSLRNKVSFS
jgi:crossover junction endodeoxyribonuclease RuvC